MKYLTSALVIALLVVAFLLGLATHRFDPAHNEVDSRTWGQQLVSPAFISGSNVKNSSLKLRVEKS